CRPCKTARRWSRTLRSSTWHSKVRRADRPRRRRRCGRRRIRPSMPFKSPGAPPFARLQAARPLAYNVICTRYLNSANEAGTIIWCEPAGYSTPQPRFFSSHQEELIMATLRLGDTAPDFEQDSDIGPIKFHDYLGDKWGVLF